MAQRISHDSARSALHASDAVDHQEEDEHDLEVDVGERAEGAAGPDRERHRREHHERHEADADGFG